MPMGKNDKSSAAIYRYMGLCVKYQGSASRPSHLILVTILNTPFFIYDKQNCWPGGHMGFMEMCLAIWPGGHIW